MMQNPFSQGFVEGLQLAKTIVFVPVVAVLLLGYVVNEFVHERTFSLRKALVAVKHQLAH